VSRVTREPFAARLWSPVKIDPPHPLHPLGQRNASLVDGVAQATSPKQRALGPIDEMAATRLPGARFRTGCQNYVG